MSAVITDEAENAGPVETGSAGGVHLWQAVIVGAIEEWRSGPLRMQRLAEHFLFEDNSDFPLVCSSAGIDYRRLRAGLGRLQNRLRHEGRPVAA
jgi:hypothetical protein